MAMSARRGWLFAALVAAVTVLVGSVVAVAAWAGAVGQPAVRVAVTGSGCHDTQPWHGDLRGPGMMGQNGRSGATTQRRSNCPDHRRG